MVDQVRQILPPGEGSGCLKCSYCGPVQPVGLQAFGKLKFIFVLAGLVGCDACDMDIVIRNHLMNHEWLDVKLVTRNLLLEVI